MSSGSIPLIHMTEGNILCRCPQNLLGKRFSVVSLGVCNFCCPYCQLGGGLPRSGVRIPLAIDVPVDEIERFIYEQVSKGNPVKISGGEPTVNMPLALRLLNHIKLCGGYACADTSGWNPEATRALAGVADQVAIDLKGVPRYLPDVTGVGLDLCWHPVLESMAIVAESSAVLEVRTVIFDFTTPDDILLMANFVPRNSYWLLRRFLTDWVPFDKYAEAVYPGEKSGSVSYPSWLRTPSSEKVWSTVESAFLRKPSHEGRCIVMTDSPRDSHGQVYRQKSARIQPLTITQM